MLAGVRRVEIAARDLMTPAFGLNAATAEWAQVRKLK